jgi:hypothetical protein
VPALIAQGKRVLVSNAGEENFTTALGPVFSGGYDRAYNQDPRTNVLLLGFTEYVQSAILKGNRDKQFDQSMAAMVDDVKDLVTQSGAPAKP